MLGRITYSLQKRSLTQHRNRDQSLAITHVQEGSADRPDPQTSALADTAAVPGASKPAIAETPDMPATMTASSTPRMVIIANDQVKVYPMMHPGQRQHKAARVKVYSQILLACTCWRNLCVPLSWFHKSAGTLQPGLDCVVQRDWVLTCGWWLWACSQPTTPCG